MGKTLFIVESPNKAKSIKKYFPEFNVVATVGHFRDLPVDRLGVDEDTHKPEYVTMKDKVDVEKKLRASAKESDVIILATDPDREGEAIAAHIANCLGESYKSRMARITYQEVTKAAINQALSQKRAIDWSLVRAQEARRVIDRYVGYLVSPVLSDKFRQVKSGVPFLSAGRVQSVAVKLVVERTREIAEFKPVEHYAVVAKLRKSGVAFLAHWYLPKPTVSSSQSHNSAENAESESANSSGLITDIALATAVKERTDQLAVSSVVKRKVLEAPPKPLTTSSFLKLASGRFKLTTKNAMAAAQKLFEQGLITYHRTDSPTMAEDFALKIRQFAVGQNLSLPEKIRVYKAKENAQEGHECLRVTDIELMQVSLGDGLLEAVYQSIWQVTLESQLADAEDEQTQINLINSAGDHFIAKGKVQIKPGWRLVKQRLISSRGGSKDNAVAAAEDSEDAEKNQQLPIIQENDVLRPEAVELQIKHTKPPAVYTEKTLVEKLEKLGIGRPSTYASIIETIVTKTYVTREDKTLRLQPTATGTAIVGALDQRFSFMEYSYTAALEELFDQIAHRKTDYLTVVKIAHQSIIGEIGQFADGTLGQAVQAQVLQMSAVSAASSKGSQTAQGKTTKSLDSKKCAAHNSSTKNQKTTANNSMTAPATSVSTSADKKSAPKKLIAVAECPQCHNGKLTRQSLKKGDNAGKHFMGCSAFPTCRFFQWVQ